MYLRCWREGREMRWGEGKGREGKPGSGKLGPTVGRGESARELGGSSRGSGLAVCVCLKGGRGGFRGDGMDEARRGGGGWVGWGGFFCLGLSRGSSEVRGRDGSGCFL